MTTSCILCGAEAEITVSGQYLAATLYEPAEGPEITYAPSCECSTHKAVREDVYDRLMQEQAEEAVANAGERDDYDRDRDEDR